VIALVGAGGKTSALFALAEELSATGAEVLLTTTTHIFDPRLEGGRPIDAVRLDGAWAEPGEAPDPWEGIPALPDRGRRVLLASRVVPSGKLAGLHPSRIPGLGRSEAFVLVEADGARRLPVKAPAPWEPALPPSTDLVLGVLGLDCLGRPMDGATVHRPERFQAITHCPFGAPIQGEHLEALALSPQGLFKGVPPGTRRALLLNKADQCSLEALPLLGRMPEACADLILVCSLQEKDPEARVLASAGPASPSRILAP